MGREKGRSEGIIVSFHKVFVGAAEMEVEDCSCLGSWWNDICVEVAYKAKIHFETSCEKICSTLFFVLRNVCGLCTKFVQ